MNTPSFCCDKTAVCIISGGFCVSSATDVVLAISIQSAGELLTGKLMQIDLDKNLKLNHFGERFRGFRHMKLYSWIK